MARQHLVEVAQAVEALHALAHAEPIRTPKKETKMVLVAKTAQTVVDQVEIDLAEAEPIEAIQTETTQTQTTMDTKAASPPPKANALPSVVDVAIVRLAHRIRAAQLRELAAQHVPQAPPKQNPAQRIQNENDELLAKAKTNASARNKASQTRIGYWLHLCAPTSPLW